jgi:hypothetical protein
MGGSAAMREVGWSPWETKRSGFYLAGFFQNREERFSGLRSKNGTWTYRLKNHKNYE